MYRVTHLSNGLTVATAEMPHMVSASVGLWIGVGSRYEPPELNGACHFIEHLFFKGTKTRSARQISEAVEGLGGYLNAYTSEEATCIHAKAVAAHVEDLLRVLFDMLLNSTFDPVEVKKEREVIKEEIAMYLDEPQHQVQELLNEVLWPGQPLGRPITGTPRSLDVLSRRELTSFLRQHYLAPRIVVVAAGRVKHSSVLKAVTPYRNKLNVGPVLPFPQAQDIQKGPVVRLHSRKTEQTQFALGIRTCSRHAPERFAIRLLHTILGENMSSRLFQTIREDRGLAYSIYSSPSFFADAGDLVISAGLEAGHLHKTLHLIIEELRRLRREAPSVAELRRARDYVFGQIDLSLEGTENQMNWVGEQWLGYGRLFRPDYVKQQLARVSRSDLRTAAHIFFRPERTNLALVSSLKSDRGLASILGRIAE